MFLQVSSPVTVYLDHPGHLALDLHSRPHSSQGSPGMEPLCSFLTHPQCCGRIPCGLSLDTSLLSKAVEGTSWVDESTQIFIGVGAIWMHTFVQSNEPIHFSLSTSFHVCDTWWLPCIKNQIKLNERHKKENANLWEHLFGFISCFCPCDLASLFVSASISVKLKLE